MSFSQLPDSPAAVFAIFLEVAVKGTLLLVLAAMTAFILRNATASLRHLLWNVALVAMLAIPALTLVLPRWNLGMVPAPASELITRRTDALPKMTDRLPPLDALLPMDAAAVSSTPELSNAGVAEPVAISSAAAGSSYAGTLAGSLALLWIGGVCAVLITIVGGMLALRRLAANAHALEGRVLKILDGDTTSRRRSSRKARVAAIAGLALVSLPLAAMQPWAGEDGRDAGESGTFASQAELLVWKGRVPAGKWVEIVVEYGEIRAELASGSEVEVYARQKNGDTESRALDRAQSTSGMTFCAMSSRTQPGAKMCAVDEMGRLNAQLRDIRVDWVVKVPAGIGIAAHTGRGNIAAEGLRSYVWATSTRGDIAITTTALAEASTGAGSISAELGRRSWKQDLEFLTGSGDVTVVAPSDAGMVIEGWTKSGVLESE